MAGDIRLARIIYEAIREVGGFEGMPPWNARTTEIERKHIDVAEKVMHYENSATLAEIMIDDAEISSELAERVSVSFD